MTSEVSHSATFLFQAWYPKYGILMPFPVPVSETTSSAQVSAMEIKGLIKYRLPCPSHLGHNTISPPPSRAH